MRLLLLFLIIINLLYASWNFYSPASRVAEVAPLGSNLRSLELLDEKAHVAENVENDEKETEAVASPLSTEEVGEAESAELLLSAEVDDFACFTLGPFKDRNIMQQVRDSLIEHVDDVSERKRVESEIHRYWVYIPPSDGRAGARAVAQRLRENRVREFYIVLKGEDKDSISLGHFREQKLANRRLKQLRNLGFNADISIIYQEYELYWLDYRVNSRAADRGFNVEEYGSEGVSQIKRDCTEVSGNPGISGALE